MTPANMADAIGLGMLETSLPSAGHNPVSAIRRPVTKKAPVALAKPSPRVPEATSKAAPGVLQTIEMGIRNCQDKVIDKTP